MAINRQFIQSVESAVHGVEFHDQSGAIYLFRFKCAKCGGRVYKGVSPQGEAATTAQDDVHLAVLLNQQIGCDACGWTVVAGAGLFTAATRDGLHSATRDNADLAVEALRDAVLAAQNKESA